jgi:hypothetical protein
VTFAVQRQLGAVADEIDRLWLVRGIGPVQVELAGRAATALVSASVAGRVVDGN